MVPGRRPMDKPLIVRPLDCCKGSDMLTDGADCNISMSVQISARCVPGLASHQYAEDLGVAVSWPWKSASPIKGMKWATAVSPPKQKPAPEDCAEYCCANAFGVAAPWSGTESSNRNGEKEAPATLLLARQNASLEACVHPPITISANAFGVALPWLSKHNSSLKGAKWVAVGALGIVISRSSKQNLPLDDNMSAKDFGVAEPMPSA